MMAKRLAMVALAGAMMATTSPIAAHAASSDSTGEPSATALVVGGKPTASVATAAAEAGCTGAYYGSFYDYKPGGNLKAITGYYWNGTDMCVVVTKQNNLYGVSTKVEIWANRQNRTTGAWTNPHYTETVKYWAGPFYVNGLNACINFETDLWNASGNNIVQDYNYAAICH